MKKEGNERKAIISEGLRSVEGNTEEAWWDLPCPLKSQAEAVGRRRCGKAMILMGTSDRIGGWTDR